MTKKEKERAGEVLRFNYRETLRLETEDTSPRREVYHVSKIVFESQLDIIEYILGKEEVKKLFKAWEE